MYIGLFDSFNWSDIWSACSNSSHRRHSQANAIFWFCLFFASTFHCFNKLLQPYLRALKVPHHKWDQTARYTWNCCFYAAAVVYLCFYRKYHLTDSLYFQRNGHSYHRSYENLLFHTADNRCALLGAITTILISFYVIDGIYDLRERNISEAIGKTVACGILVYFDVYRLEYFSVIFNILLVLINLSADGVRLVAGHISDQNAFALRVCLCMKLLSWSFVYLSWLPFQILIPTLYGRKFHLWLNVFLWLWYGIGVWNSPLLQIMHHRIYHTSSNSNECLGEIARCILIRESSELRHLKKLESALTDIRSLDQVQPRPQSAGNKAYQTMKCMITLKRKLKRIRQNKENQAEAMQSDRDVGTTTTKD